MLSKSCDEAIDRAALIYECSRSQAIERLFILDYSDLFRRFERKESFSKIVIDTHGDPNTIRKAFQDYEKGFEMNTLEESEILDKKIQVELEALRVRLEIAQGTERVEVMKLETKRDLAKRREDLLAAQANSKARIERLRALSAPAPSFER